MIQLRTVIALFVIAVLFLALFPASAQPIRWQEERKTWHPNTAAEMQVTAADIDRRLDAGEYVFTVMAEYHSLSDHHPPYSPRIYNLVSPQQGQIGGLNQTDWHDIRRDQFTADLKSGRIALLVMTKRTAFTLHEWSKAQAAFEANFCRVNDTPAVYRRHDVWLFEYAPQRGDCVNQYRFEFS